MVVTRYLNRPRYLEAVFPWLFILLAVCYVAYHWSNPMTRYPDSGGYLEFNSARTAGYPVFLDLVIAVFGSVDAVPKAQLVIAAAAFAFLGWGVYRAFGTIFFPLVPVVALMLYPRIGDAHSYILTESLFITLLCLLVGCIALIARRPSWRWTAAAALACGLAIAVRPAGVSLLIIWPFLFWLIWRRCDGRRIALATAAIAPIALCLIAENQLWHAYHESEPRPNLADRHLFAKALIIEPEPRVSDPELANILAEGRRVMAPARELIAEAPSHYLKMRLLGNLEVAAQYTTYGREFAPKVNAIAQQRGVGEYDVLAQMGRPAMLNAPVAWMGNALVHYFGLWFPYWEYFSLEISKKYQAYIDDAEPNAVFTDASISSLREPPRSRRYFLLRLTAAAGLLTSTLATGLVAWQRLRLHSRSPDSRLVVVAVCILGVHAHFLTVGLFGVAVVRYTDTMVPLLAVCGVLLASWMIEYARSVAAGRFPALTAPNAGGSQ